MNSNSPCKIRTGYTAIQNTEQRRYITYSLHLARKYINNSHYLARKYARIFVRGHYLFQEANSFPRAKLEQNCELRGTGNVQGQISVHIFEAKWRLLCSLSFKYFFTRPHFGRPFLKSFKRQSSSVSSQNIGSLFKMLSCIHFNNLLGIKTNRANVNRKVRELGNITWGISSDLPQF